jgi:hypothetical protein
MARSPAAVHAIGPASGPAASAAPDTASPATPAGGPPGPGGPADKTPTAGGGASPLTGRSFGGRPPGRGATEQITSPFKKPSGQAGGRPGNGPFQCGLKRSFALDFPVIGRVGN